MRTPRRTSSRPPPVGAEQAQGSGTRTKFDAPLILVVDDGEDNRELFATVLRDAGFLVTTAADGMEALEVAAREKPCVIVMDLAMPRMDGFDAIERLRLEEHGRAAAIIVVSAFSDRLSRTRAADLGADAFLAKPCAPRDLVARVEELIANMESPKAAAG